LFARYRGAAVDIPGDTFDRIRATVAGRRVHVVVGVIERAGHTLYCTALLIAPDGTLLGHHRKLVPTGTERLIWGPGEAADVAVVDTDLGRVGMAICWENYMPLYRTALYERGVQLYCAPTVDSRDTWAATMRHIGVEGRCFVVSATQFATREDYPPDFPLGPDPVVIRGGSCVVDPFGRFLAGPVFERQEVLLADLDLTALDGAYLDLDVVGHYARPDIFRLTTTTASARAGSTRRHDQAAGFGEG
jgi:nitrilase